MVFGRSTWFGAAYDGRTRRQPGPPRRPPDGRQRLRRRSAHPPAGAAARQAPLPRPESRQTAAPRQGIDRGRPGRRAGRPVAGSGAAGMPVMLCPRWLSTPTQPIAVDDVLAYVLAAKDLPPGEGRIFEIGSED